MKEKESAEDAQTTGAEIVNIPDPESTHDSKQTARGMPFFRAPQEGMYEYNKLSTTKQDIVLFLWQNRNTRDTDPRERTNKYMSYADITDELEWAVETVRKAIGQLAKSGHIEKTDQKTMYKPDGTPQQVYRWSVTMFISRAIEHLEERKTEAEQRTSAKAKPTKRKAKPAKPEATQPELPFEDLLQNIGNGKTSLATGEGTVEHNGRIWQKNGNGYQYLRNGKDWIFTANAPDEVKEKLGD